MTLSSRRGVRCGGLIGPVVAQHCPQHVEASAGQCEDCLGVGFAFGSFAVVVGARGGVGADGDLGGQVAGAQQAAVVAAGAFEVAADAARIARYRGQSGEALITGERDPHTLAELALGRLRGKQAVLIDALTGTFTEHHAFLARAMLDRIDAATAMHNRLTARIDSLVQPYRSRVELLASVPGVSEHTAQVILAEIGSDIARFPSAGHLASWAGVCPGNNESAGKHSSGTTRPGDPWLKSVLGQAAIAACPSTDTYLAARYRRVMARRGRKRALVALQHSILIAIWHMFTNDTTYHDLGANYFVERAGKARATRRLIGQLNHLGYQVTLNPLAVT
jgi:transposase